MPAHPSIGVAASATMITNKRLAQRILVAPLWLRLGYNGLETEVIQCRNVAETRHWLASPGSAGIVRIRFNFRFSNEHS
jgi:hypothetical protein